MTSVVSERSFEEAIECALLKNGPDACPGDARSTREASLAYGEALLGGYHKRSPSEYVRLLCLLPRDLLAFVLAAQAQAWERLKQRHGAEVKDRFVRRVARGIAAAFLRMSRSCAVTSQLLPQASYLGLGRF